MCRARPGGVFWGPPFHAAKGAPGSHLAPSVSVPTLERWPRPLGRPPAGWARAGPGDRLSIPVIATVEAEDSSPSTALELGLRAQDEARICTVASRGRRLVCEAEAPVGGFRDLGSRARGFSLSAGLASYAGGSFSVPSTRLPEPHGTLLPVSDEERGHGPGGRCHHLSHPENHW